LWLTAGGTNTQQSINAKIAGLWRSLSEGNTRSQRTLVRRQGVRWRFVGVAKPSHQRLLSPTLQVHGGFQPIAAVVTRAARHPETLAVRGYCQCQLRHRQTCAPHQGVRWQASLSRGFEITCGIIVVKGQVQASSNF
jgi:hypothetical protein